MAVRQYIGARYVPKFYENSDGTSEWRSGVSYEPLTIVTYNSNSYTSKKSVPSDVGNPSSNPEFWASTGNYNEQVEEYRREVEEYRQEVEEIYNKKIAIIGDSYATDNNYGSGVIVAYPTRVKSFLGLSDENFKKATQNGAGFNNGVFLSLLNSLEDDADLDELYVFGGWNDAAADAEEVHEKMATFTTRAKEKFPKAKLYLGVLGYGYVMSDEYISYFKNLDRYTYGQATRYGFSGYLNTKGICVNQDAVYWANVDTSQGRTHPSAILQVFIAIYISNIITTKNNKMLYTLTAECTTDDDSEYTVTNGGDILMNNDGDNVHVDITKAIVINAKNATTGAKLNSLFSGSGTTQIGTLNKSMVECIADRLRFNCKLRYRTVAGGNTWYLTDAQLYIHNKKVYLNTFEATNISDVSLGYIYAHGQITTQYLLDI